jgi:GT2 family glycosyltransferase
MKVNIAILNYNGKKLLRECLPSIIEAASKSRFKPTVTVLDNKSSDGSVVLLKEGFPSINVYLAKENRVYSSYNDFCADIDDDIVVVLNSDIKVEPDFLDSLIEHFEKDQTVFFVASRMYFFDKKTYQGDRSKARFRYGAIFSDTRFRGYEGLIDKSGYAFSTGNGAFDRRKFLELGGFDDIYLPGRYEDVDLCYRAWRYGYKGVYEPRSVVYHKGYGSFKQEYTDDQIQQTVFRNSIIFMTKNITDLVILLGFYAWLPPRLVIFLLTGRIFFIRGFFQAMRLLPQAIRKKKASLNSFKHSDREVLKIVG